MKLTTTQKWLRTIAWLRRNFPPVSAAYIKSVPMKKHHGYTELEVGYFQIKINCKQSFSLRIDTLIHEWAHVLTWFGAETHEDHSTEWGLAYAKIYRTFVEWDFGRKAK
jgi:hypothetical protein